MEKEVALTKPDSSSLAYFQALLSGADRESEPYSHHALVSSFITHVLPQIRPPSLSGGSCREVCVCARVYVCVRACARLSCGHTFCIIPQSKYEESDSGCALLVLGTLWTDMTQCSLPGKTRVPLQEQDLKTPPLCILSPPLHEKTFLEHLYRPHHMPPKASGVRGNTVTNT